MTILKTVFARPSYSQFTQTARLALPIIAAQLAQMGMEVVDTIMIGHLGVDELASAALAGPAYFTVLVFFLGLLTAIGITLSRERGAGQHENLGHWLQQGFNLSLLCCLPAMLLVWFLPNYLLFTGQKPHLVGLASEYLHSVVWSIPAIYVYVALREYLTALHRPRVVMWIALTAIPFDVLLNNLFMHGAGPIPAMGIAGAGWATVLISWLMLLALFLYTLRDKQLSSACRAAFPLTFKASPVIQLLKLGWPIGLSLVFEVGLFSVTATMMGHFGREALAAHQIAMQASSITFMFYLGTAQATAIRVSHALGANKANELGAIANSGIAFSLVFAVIAAILFVVAPEFISYLFLDDSEPEKELVLHFSLQFLAISALFQLSDGFQVVLNSALRGLKDTFIPMLIGLGAYWIVGISTGYAFAFVLPLKSNGLWWGLLAGLTASGILLGYRFYTRAYELGKV